MMKIVFTIITLFVSIGISGEPTWNTSFLLNKGGTIFAPNNPRPYWGEVFELKDNGLIEFTGHYEGGKRSNVWQYYGQYMNLIRMENYNGHGIKTKELTGKWSTRGGATGTLKEWDDEGKIIKKESVVGYFTNRSKGWNFKK
jgi:hypothetical protein